MQVVWFKRDLRVQDHLPLYEAALRGPVLPLFVDEPAILLADDQSAQHARFREECLGALAHALAGLGAPLQRRRADMLTVLDELQRLGPIEGLWSHEETGNALTYQRDLAVADWCRRHGVPWFEYPQHGVIRRLASRNGWAQRWEQRMRSPLAPTPPLLHSAWRGGQAPTAGWPSFDGPCIPAGADKPGRQRGGRQAAIALLESFLAGRGQDYRRGMSSPLSAAQACSRLSPYLALGVLSLRETAQALARRATALREGAPADPGRSLLPALTAFAGRLHWHCHFMQKLESQPAIEFHNIHRGFDGLREDSFDPVRFAAWCQGETGYPMVDACQRMLAATGWINFRMRAMLVSFAAYQLWLHWRQPALYLAREFLDYEPGIHYAQMQMQSGVTGINTLRIYNPVKQARDHDPHGRFVRRWIPALAGVPDDWIFEPWRMPQGIQAHAGVRIGVDYPAPVVDHEAAARLARQRIGARRAEPAVQTEARVVLARHGSRKAAGARRSGRAKSAASTPDRQEGFDFGQG